MRSRVIGPFRACPRCHGQVFREYDLRGGWDRVCLQCGYRRGLVVATAREISVAQWAQEPEARNPPKGGTWNGH